MGQGGFGKGGGFGDKGKGKGKGKKGGKGKGKGKGSEEKEWVPCTKLGRLVKDQKVQSVEDIYLHSLPIKEYQIIDVFFAPGTLKDEVMKIHPVQKMTSAGQRNRFVCYVLVGDQSGPLGRPSSSSSGKSAHFVLHATFSCFSSAPTTEDISAASIADTRSTQRPLGDAQSSSCSSSTVPNASSMPFRSWPTAHTEWCNLASESV